MAAARTREEPALLFPPPFCCGVPSLVASSLAPPLLPAPPLPGESRGVAAGEGTAAGVSAVFSGMTERSVSERERSAQTQHKNTPPTISNHALSACSATKGMHTGADHLG